MCKALGFRALDVDLRIFHGRTGSTTGSVDVKEFSLIKERMMRQDKRLNEIPHQFSELLTRERKMATDVPESVSRQFESLERRVEDLAHVCEETR